MAQTHACYNHWVIKFCNAQWQIELILQDGKREEWFTPISSHLFLLFLFSVFSPCVFFFCACISLLSQFSSSWSLSVLSPFCLSASCVVSWNALLLLKMQLWSYRRNTTVRSHLLFLCLFGPPFVRPHPPTSPFPLWYSFSSSSSCAVRPPRLCPSVLPSFLPLLFWFVPSPSSFCSLAPGTPPPPLLFFLWLFIRPENVDNNCGMASVGGTIWDRDVTMIDGGFPVGSDGWRRQWMVKRRRLQLKWLFPIGSLNVWHLIIKPWVNCNWTLHFLEIYTMILGF